MRLLGQLVLLRVENAQVKHDDLSAWFDELHLDPHFLPARTSPVNSFKKSATGDSTKLSYDAPWAHKTAVATVKWEDESHDTERIVRRAVRTVKVAGKNGPTVMVARATFYKRSRRAVATGQGGEKIRYQLERDNLHDAEVAVIQQWLDDSKRRYDAGQIYVDADALRGTVRDYLTKRLKALMVRPMVYFVYRQLAEEMKRLETLVTRFGDECMFHLIDLPDEPWHRALLQRSLGNAINQSVVALQREAHALRAKHPRAIPQAAFAPLVTKYEDIMETAHEYAGAIGGADLSALERLTETVVSLRGSVK